MSLNSDTISGIFLDIKSDLLKSAVSGMIIAIVTALFSLAVEEIPTELKQIQVLFLFGLVVAICIFSILLIRRYRPNSKLISLIISIAVIGLAINIYVFVQYVWKGILFNDDPIFIIFYPEKNTDSILQNQIQSSITELPGRLKDRTTYYQIKKIALSNNFDFDHSLIKAYVDNTPNVISYVKLIPNNEKIDIIFVFPAALPYQNIGLQTILNYTDDNAERLLAKFHGRVETFSFEFERYIKHSKIHYGFTGGGFSIIPRINQNGVTLKDISQSLLKPSNLNQTIDPNEISGRVYFDFTLGLMQYYSLIGEYDISCEILKDYIAFDNLENVKNNLNFHSSEVIFSCLKKTIIEGDRSFLTYLTDQQREQVQKDLLSQLIEGKKSLNYLINLSLFDDKEGLQALDEISETCLLLTDYEFQKEHISIFANCLHDLLIENIDFIKKHQFLRNLATEIVKSYYNHWLNTNKNHFGAALYYAQTVPTMYREFEQGEKSCESLWQTLAAPLGITFLKHNTNILLNYNSSVDNFLDNLLRISQFSNCNNITFFEFNFNKLVFNTNGRILVKNLANDILVDLINDVTVYKLLSDIENNLVNITSFSENYKAEEKLKQWFNLIKKDPINWLRQEYEYYTNKLKIPKSELSGIINLIYNENNFKLYENVTINDKVSNWLPLINQFPLTDNNGEIRTSLSQEISKLHLLEHYFIDSFSSQLFGMMPNFTDKEQKHFFQRVTQRIRNQRLDQMVLYENLTSVDATPAQRSATLQILEREYSDSVSNSILKHFEFYVNYKNGDFKKALLALDTLIELNELPYSDFYRFAKSVIQFLANTKICTGNPEGAKRILDKLLKNTSNDYWDNPSGTNHVSLRLQEYLRQFVINEGKNDPELVEVFKSCID